MACRLQFAPAEDTHLASDIPRRRCECGFNFVREDTYKSAQKFTDYSMFEQLIKNFNCKVCILDVGDLSFQIVETVQKYAQAFGGHTALPQHQFHGVAFCMESRVFWAS